MSYWKIEGWKFVCDSCHKEIINEEWYNNLLFPENWMSIYGKDYCPECYENFKKNEFKNK